MTKLNIPKSCAMALAHWLRKIQDEDRWHQENEARRRNPDGEAQYAGRLRLISRILFHLEDNIPKNKED